MAQSILAAHSPPPPRYFVIVLFWNSCTVPSGGSAVSHKKTHCWALKSVQLCFTLGQHQKEIRVFHFPVNVS